MDTARIVVGVDGSQASTAAVRWAAAEAWLREADLEVLMAYQSTAPRLRFGTSAAFQRAADERAAGIVDDAVSEAKSITPHTPIRGNAVIGYPAQVLLKAARGADLVVVGSRGRGGFGGLLLGSVSAQVATHASCSVVVVRGRANTAIGPVVVGVDDSPSAQAALGLAFAEAALRRQATLEAVTAYPPPVPMWTGGPPPPPYDPDHVDDLLRRELDRQLLDWRDKYPDVTVEAHVVSGGAASVLVERSHRAQLVVVGARSRGGFDGLLLGSVGLHLLHHADCPVLIARTAG